jgi:hypothetical protein
MLGGLCQNSTVPTDAELQSLFEQVKTNLGNGTSTGTANGSNNLTVTNDTLRNQFDQCLSKVPQEKVEEVMAWIEQLTGAAQ